MRNWKGVYEATRVMEKLLKHHGPGGWNVPWPFNSEGLTGLRASFPKMETGVS